MVRNMVSRAGLWTGTLLSVAVAPQLVAQQDSTLVRLEERIQEVDQQARIAARQFELYRERVMGYLAVGRSRRELRADRILAISTQPTETETSP